MFSWRTVRVVCLVLLLLPVVHVAYLISGDVVASLDPSPDAWQDEIDAYRRADLAGTLSDHPIVVVGGLRVRLWEGLEDLLAPRPVLMRGLGDATIDDIIHNYGQLIAYYRPSTVVFLPGNSEFHIRDSKSAEELVTAIRQLVALDASQGTNAHYYLISPIKTPLHASDYDKIDTISSSLASWAAQQARVTVLDANRMLQTRDRTPNPAFFRADGVNLNEHGYLRLSTLVLNHVEKASCCG
jgi:hypothetical protein